MLTFYTSFLGTSLPTEKTGQLQRNNAERRASGMAVVERTEHGESPRQPGLQIQGENVAAPGTI